MVIVFAHFALNTLPSKGRGKRGWRYSTAVRKFSTWPLPSLPSKGERLVLSDGYHALRCVENEFSFGGYGLDQSWPEPDRLDVEVVCVPEGMYEIGSLVIPQDCYYPKYPDESGRADTWVDTLEAAGFTVTVGYLLSRPRVDRITPPPASG